MMRWITLALVFACACRGDEGGGDEASPAVHVRCAPVAVATLPRTRVLRGVVAPAPESDSVVAPLVGGVLARVLVREGDVVRAGQVLAEVDAQALRDVLTEARSALAQARATGASDEAQLEHERRLVEQGIAARHGLEVAMFADDHSRAGVAAAQASVSIASRNVQRSQVRAPIAGVVLRVLRHAGELVDGTAATAVLEIADPAGLEMSVGAAPADLVELARGQRGAARFDALGDGSWDVSVRSFAPAVDPVTGVGNVRFAFAPSDGRMPPFGVFGTVELRVGERAGALTVPSSALRNPSEEGAEVLVCQGGHARVRVVRPGIRSGDVVEIVDGLAEGERVVVDDVIGVEDETPIVEAR